MSLKQIILFCLVFFLQFSVATFAKEDCSKELLLTYFPEPFVNQTLAKYHVDKDHWEAINKDLAERDDDVIRFVEEKASKMSPNPLLDPSQRQVAVKLFRETLFQVFSDVLYAHGVTDQKKAQEMLDDIQQQKAERFADCMRNQDVKGYKPSQEEDFEHED